MAVLQNKTNITLEELEEHLGEKKLPEFITVSEKAFIDQIDAIVEAVNNDRSKRAIFVSGPTSSGKTTFTMRLSAGLQKAGRSAAFLSLDDYYNMKNVVYDKDGRPDYESIDTLDVERARRDIGDLIHGKTVIPPFFDFLDRTQKERDESEAITIDSDGILVVEGLHGLNKRISGEFIEEAVKVFIMPYGNVFADTKLMDRTEIRMLRRIVRDNRHRGTDAISTIDYWPMIARSEEAYYVDYLTAADYHVNSFLPYESLIIAPIALEDITKALKMAEDGKLNKSVFMAESNSNKSFADLSLALSTASKLVEHLKEIPRINPDFVPQQSILNEFISM